MTDRITITPCGPVHGAIRPPGSKSITNRALICAALAEGESLLTGALASEDTHVMLDSLHRLGVRAEEDQTAATIAVAGCGGVWPRSEADLFVGNSGTTIRFLTAALAVGQGRFRLDGVPRMRERPIQDLLSTLQSLGSDVVSEAGTGCPPVLLSAQGLRGGRASVRGDVSSQFLSGLLMAAPYAADDVEVVVSGELVSQPYVRMTLAVMRSFGVTSPDDADLSRFVIPGRQKYRGLNYAIEPDASAASYFWGAAAISGGDVLVEGLSPSALQGDVAFVDCLRQMGCVVQAEAAGIRVRGGPLRGIDVDMNAISDTVQTLGAVALFASGPTNIRGVAHIRHKETDRIGDLARELRKFGAVVEERSDGMTIHPAANLSVFNGAQIATYNDHRMAMSLALPGLRLPGVMILNPGCTAKTYPQFFSDLARLTGVKG